MPGRKPRRDYVSLAVARLPGRHAMPRQQSGGLDSGLCPTLLIDAERDGGEGQSHDKAIGNC
jgi:hypothetical protein